MNFASSAKYNSTLFISSTGIALQLKGRTQRYAIVAHCLEHLVARHPFRMLAMLASLSKPTQPWLVPIESFHSDFSLCLPAAHLVAHPICPNMSPYVPICPRCFGTIFVDDETNFIARPALLLAKMHMFLIAAKRFRFTAQICKLPSSQTRGK